MSLNLFSMFDPASSSSMSMNWLCLFIPIVFMPISFWNFKSRFSFMFFYMNFYLLNELKKNINMKNYKSLIFLISIFWFIFLLNFWSLFPYIFSATSHLSVSCNFSLLFWMNFVIFSMIHSSNKMFYHLVPLNCPLILSPFMVIIETISNLIRPLTLSIRLSANLTAGHLLLTLLSSLSEKFMFLYIPSFPAMTFLFILEIAVSLIQSYVFFTLISLYLNEM